MDVDFVSTVAVIVADPPRARGLFIDALGLPLEREGDGYYSSGDIRGCNHFGVWPLSQAAEACFGTPEWPLSDVQLQKIVQHIERGDWKASPSQIFSFEDIQKAHRIMEANEANGKVVVRVD